MQEGDDGPARCQTMESVSVCIWRREGGGCLRQVPSKSRDVERGILKGGNASIDRQP